MSRQRSRDTTPEVNLRRVLHAAGYRYRLNVSVPGLPRRTIDVAFSGAKVAVFVDGCFWHACPEHASWPHRNAVWWRDKLARNVDRDRETTERLLCLGWAVVRVWEHESTSEAMAKVEVALRLRAGRGARPNQP